MHCIDLAPIESRLAWSGLVSLLAWSGLRAVLAHAQMRLQSATGMDQKGRKAGWLAGWTR